MSASIWDHVPGGEPTERQKRIAKVSSEMRQEAERALKKHGAENTMDAPGKTDGDRLAILMEEVGEASEEYLHALLVKHVGAVAHELTYDAQRIEMIPGWSDEGVEVQWHGKDCYINGELVGNPFVMTDEQLATHGLRREDRKAKLRKELIQVGAMAATWAAMLD